MTRSEDVLPRHLECAFTLAVGGVVLFAGIFPVILAKWSEFLSPWLYLLAATVPIQAANIASCVLPAIRYCPGKTLADVLDLKIPAPDEFVLIIPGTVAVYFGLAVITGITAWLLQNTGIPARDQAILEILKNGPPLLSGMLIPIAVLLAPAGEELCFRYAIYRKLEFQLGPVPASGLTALIFAAVHWNLQVFPALFLLSLWLTFLYRKTRTLAAPMAAHALFNAMTVLLVYLSARYFH